MTFKEARDFLNEMHNVGLIDDDSELYFDTLVVNYNNDLIVCTQKIVNVSVVDEGIVFEGRVIR
ncbi:hypothetical protein 000TH008_254 [Bacillus phage 000TH008]|nr:hypothetical protein 000TH008_254 [Bacillus phage 000TH008]QQO40947.1 hypothetical protein 000TH009_254 [Bacillus phage 000TH009]QQO41471.1 hypothetical protein 015DV004_256 [Bacillus phage 015DV004]